MLIAGLIITHTIIAALLYVNECVTIIFHWDSEWVYVVTFLWAPKLCELNLLILLIVWGIKIQRLEKQWESTINSGEEWIFKHFILSSSLLANIMYKGNSSQLRPYTTHFSSSSLENMDTFLLTANRKHKIVKYVIYLCHYGLNLHNKPCHKCPYNHQNDDHNYHNYHCSNNGSVVTRLWHCVNGRKNFIIQHDSWELHNVYYWPVVYLT